MPLDVHDELVPADLLHGGLGIDRALGTDFERAAGFAALPTGRLAGAGVQDEQGRRGPAGRQEELAPAHPGPPGQAVARFPGPADRFGHHRPEGYRVVLGVGGRPELDRQPGVLLAPVAPAAAHPTHLDVASGAAVRSPLLDRASRGLRGLDSFRPWRIEGECGSARSGRRWTWGGGSKAWGSPRRSTQPSEVCTTSTPMGHSTTAGHRTSPRCADGLKGKALDVNDTDPMDDGFRKDFRTEREALQFLYFRLLHAAEKFGWPLDELFFAGFGYIKEEGRPTEAPNHPVPNHENHLHVALTESDF